MVNERQILQQGHCGALPRSRNAAALKDQLNRGPVGTIRCHSRAREAGGGALPTDLSNKTGHCGPTWLDLQLTPPSCE
jgi:hypothetical protein